MEKAKMAAFPIIGAIFLFLALVKFVNGDKWVVWFILGCIFGGLRMFRRNRTEGGQS